ncbi:hypothetical protein [Nevskia sp.]|uniref:hypothetical protein n=1 Tax=Nevskia sp. TaxID=1929292 RepID=UPI0025D7380A|nr:hypothetical protein [Nevskia sp.]
MMALVSPLLFAADESPAPSTDKAAPATSDTSKDSFDFFSDQPVAASDIVQLPPEKPTWQTIGGPIALLAFFFALNLVIWRLVPFSSHSIDINLRHFPPAAKRGIAMAVVIFGIAFVFGASEISYQLNLHGSASAYFEQMSLGKLIAFSHAHLFGFTTSFFIVGIPFSLQFNQLRVYQWVFPVGLAASLVDVMSWWGIKYVSANFEWISLFCGLLFTISYGWMLIGLLRVLLFPEVIWGSDKDRAERLAKRQAPK